MRSYSTWHQSTRNKRMKTKDARLDATLDLVENLRVCVTLLRSCRGVCVSACCSVPPQCNFSLSLFCNYYDHAVLPTCLRIRYPTMELHQCYNYQLNHIL